MISSVIIIVITVMFIRAASMVGVLMLFVSAHVTMHITISSEGEMTIFAIEWPLTRMHQYMTI